jgi:CRISPR-associated protein Csd2
MPEIINDINRRHDFVLLFDVQDGNPNGDPDAGNLPRIDPETMHGLVSDVCLKRKVRNYVDALRGTEKRFKIYVQNKEALNALHERAYTEKKIKSTGSKQKREDVQKVRSWMCENFYDIRTFGALMATEFNCGQVRGPVQITFARSFDPVVPQEIAITRIAITKKEDMDYVAANADTNQKEKGGKVTEMGRKAIVPYGLFRVFGFFNPLLAKDTGFDEEDLALFWQSLRGMWDLDRSAARGLMACRALYVFTHETQLGNAPADQLFALITNRVRCRAEVPRSIADYDLPHHEEVQLKLPQNVEVHSLVTLPEKVAAVSA